MSRRYWCLHSWLNCAAQRTICYDGSVVSPLTPLSPPPSVSVSGGYSSKGLKDVRNCSSTLLPSVFLLSNEGNRADVSRSVTLRPPVSLCVSLHILSPMSKIDLFTSLFHPASFFFFFSPSFFPHSRLSLPLSVFHGCQRDICVLWMWSRGDVWMFWSRTVCLTSWIQTETYWFLVCDGIRS